MKRILIAGAGTAGSIVANKLARELRRNIAKDRVKVTLLDRDRMAINRAGFTFVPFGYLTKEDLVRDKKSLISPRVECHFGKEGRITAINLNEQKVSTFSGKTFGYDYLVISTGSVPSPKSVKGLNSDYNTFYTSIEDAQNLGQKIRTFDKGRIVVLAPKMPVPCPGAAAKFSILLSDYLQYVRTKSRKDIEIEILWPTKAIGPPAYNKIVEEACKEKDIMLSKPFLFDHVDEESRQIVPKDGNPVRYDLLVTVPPYKTDQSLVDSNMTDKGVWLDADKTTLQYRDSGVYDNVFAIGDNGSSEIPKTGIAAHYQALITAQNIINKISGNDTVSPYRGEAGCPFVYSSYTPHTRGKAYIPIWTYDRMPEPFPPTELGWLFYRMYYYMHWDTTIKALA